MIFFPTEQSNLIERECMECSSRFLAPPANTTCYLPDGGIVCYKDETNLCPNCDDNMFGMEWNKDFKGEDDSG